MTNDTRPREWWITELKTAYVTKEAAFHEDDNPSRAIEYSAYEAAIKRAEAAEKERDELKLILSGRTLSFDPIELAEVTERAEAAEKDRDALIRLISGDEVELMSNTPSYHATIRLEEDHVVLTEKWVKDPPVATNPSESESAGPRPGVIKK